MEADQIEAAVDDAIRRCDGDLRATIRALIVTVEYRQEEVTRLAEAVSPGYMRAPPTTGQSANGHILKDGQMDNT